MRVEQAASVAAKVDAALAKAARISLEVEIEQLKFQIAKLKKERFGASSEHGAKLDQLALALEYRKRCFQVTALRAGMAG